MHLAAQVAELDERAAARPRGPPRARRVLAQLRRDEGVAEERVELLLVAEGLHLARLDHGDAVLGDREPAPLRLLAQRDVVLLRAGEVLEQVAVALRRDDAEIEPEPLLGDHRRLGVAVGDDLEHPRQRRRSARSARPGRWRSRSRRGRGTSRAGGARCPPRRRRRAAGCARERLDHLAHDRQAVAEQAAPRLARRPAPSASAFRIFSSVRRAEARERAQPLSLAPPPSARRASSRRARARSGPPSSARARAAA